MVMIRVGEVEDRRQVAGHRAAPWGDVLLGYPETLLDELDNGRVIEYFGSDVAALAPR